MELSKILFDAIGLKNNKDIFSVLENIFNNLLPIKHLREYGVRKEDIDAFKDNVITNQQRLLKNNYVQFSRNDIRQIYKRRF